MNQKPSVRLARVMSRLSRDKWMHPKDVVIASRKFANRFSASPPNVISAAFAYACHFVGMVDGCPPFHPKEPGYMEFMNWVEKGNKRTPAELVILKLKLKAMKNGN